LAGSNIPAKSGGPPPIAIIVMFAIRQQSVIEFSLYRKPERAGSKATSIRALAALFLAMRFG